MQSQTPRASFNGHPAEHAQPAHTVTTLHPGPPSRKVPWLALGAYLFGILGVALGALALALFLSYRSTETAQTAQMNQMRQALAQAQTNLARAQSEGASSFASVNKRIDGMATVLSGLAPFTQSCSSAMTTTGGAAVAYVPCTLSRP